MDDNTDYMVFRENDEYDIINEIQKASDSDPENDNVDNEQKFIKDKIKNNKDYPEKKSEEN